MFPVKSAFLGTGGEQPASSASRAPRTFKEIRDQIPEAAREFLCLKEDGTLLISKTHQFNAQVQGCIARFQRIGISFQKETCDLDLVRRMNAQQDGLYADDNHSDMQRSAKDLFERAVKLRASDIHIRIVKAGTTRVLFRIHGDLVVVEEQTSDFGEKLCTAIYQSMTDVSDTTFEVLNRQDARISDRQCLPEGLDGIRIATTPQVGGFIMVLRMLYNDTVDSFDLRLLGFTHQHSASIDLMKRRPTGINIIAGPTGAGKSTTLQRILLSIIQATEGRKHLITVEDPPEYPIVGAVQTPVANADSAEERSMAFQSAIKAAMRLDPDIMMIGEMRDNPSASLAVQASMTGHQVWTTLHANNAFAILDRLEDLGLPLQLLTDHSIVTGLICQRLVKTLCPHCKVKLMDVLERYHKQDIRRITSVARVENMYVMGEGCDHCGGSGTKGRTVVAEMITTDPRLMELVRNRDRIKAMEYWRREQGGKSMLAHAIDKVNEGTVDPFAAEDVVGPLNMEIMESDNRIEAVEIQESFGGNRRVDDAVPQERVQMIDVSGGSLRQNIPQSQGFNDTGSDDDFFGALSHGTGGGQR